jgi:hypothetical protein
VLVRNHDIRRDDNFLSVRSGAAKFDGKRLNLPPGFFERSGTIYFLGGEEQFFGHRKLHADAAACFLIAQPARAEPLELLRGFAPRNDQTVKLLVDSSLDNQRRFDKGRVANALALALLELTKQRGFDSRMDNSVEAVEFGAIREDNRGELGAVHAAISDDDGRPELTDDFVMSSLAGLDQLVGKRIGVENGEAHFAEHRGNGAFAAGDAAGKAKSKHGRGLSRKDGRLSRGIFG